MNRATNRLTLAVVAAVLAAGCSAYEQQGEYHKAYDVYLRELKASPRNGIAAAGLRRTAPAAARYWLGQAYQAAEGGDWARAAACHRRVLEIKPDELASILSLRQMARHHPDEVAEALGRPVELPLAAAPTAGTPDAPPIPDESVAALPAARPSRESVPPPARTDREAAPAAAPPPPPAAGPTAGKPGPPGEASARPAKPPAPAEAPRRAATPPPSRQSPSAGTPERKPVEVFTTPSPTSRPADRRTIRISSFTPPPPPPDLTKQKPLVHPRSNAFGEEFILVDQASKKDKRYPRHIILRDGLSVKVKGTDRKPLEAELEIYLGTKSFARMKHLAENNAIGVFGYSRQYYEIVIMEIDERTETVTVGVRRLGPERSRGNASP